MILNKIAICLNARKKYNNIMFHDNFCSERYTMKVIPTESTWRVSWATKGHEGRPVWARRDVILLYREAMMTVFRCWLARFKNTPSSLNDYGNEASLVTLTCTLFANKARYPVHARRPAHTGRSVRLLIETLRLPATMATARRRDVKEHWRTR